MGRKKAVKDAVGEHLFAGSCVAYPVRHGSVMEMKFGVIESFFEGGIRVRQGRVSKRTGLWWRTVTPLISGKLVTVTRLDRVIATG